VNPSQVTVIYNDIVDAARLTVINSTHVVLLTRRGVFIDF